MKCNFFFQFFPISFHIWSNYGTDIFQILIFLKNLLGLNYFWSVYFRPKLKQYLHKQKPSERTENFRIFQQKPIFVQIFYLYILYYSKIPNPTLSQVIFLGKKSSTYLSKSKHNSIRFNDSPYFHNFWPQLALYVYSPFFHFSVIAFTASILFQVPPVKRKNVNVKFIALIITQ